MTQKNNGNPTTQGKAKTKGGDGWLYLIFIHSSWQYFLYYLINLMYF